MYKNHNI